MDTAKIKRKLILVGVGRSGTSLLQSMLASNSQVAFLPEQSFFRRYIAAYKSPLKNGLRECPNNVLKSDKRLLRIDNICGVLDNFDWSLRSPEWRLYEALFGLPDNVSWVGDKDPRSIEYLFCLARAFPKAKFIHLYRDPRDVVASKKAADWSKGRSLFSYLVAGNAQIALAQKNGITGERLLHVQYEELIQQSPETLERICNWLNIDFEPEMLDFNTAARTLVADDEMQWKKETLGPLLPNNCGKWKHSLSRLEILAIERACDNAMRLGPYDASLAKASILIRLAACLLGWTARLASQVYVWNRRRLNKQIPLHYD